MLRNESTLYRCLCLIRLVDHVKLHKLIAPIMERKLEPVSTQEADSTGRNGCVLLVELCKDVTPSYRRSLSHCHTFNPFSRALSGSPFELLSYVLLAIAKDTLEWWSQNPTQQNVGSVTFVIHRKQVAIPSNMRDTLIAIAFDFSLAVVVVVGGSGHFLRCRCRWSFTATIKLIKVVCQNWKSIGFCVSTPQQPSIPFAVLLVTSIVP